MLTEPGWDTTDYEDYYLQPAIAELFIFKAETGDTIGFPRIADCYIIPDLMNFYPAAIVQSNSSGYYELALEAGNYQYMVRTPYGFYIDAFISSRIPGQFEVMQDSVTILNVHIEPCVWF